ncbi:hypothetical protein F9B74_07260 [Pelistega sp. NLN82]|uniref:Uracil-DNA glycosylase-like domain-containing protein n=1 Tax=Pelistega ratti TaxID=2652177 RepID=A0A6L9Y6T0_9BURK|nr:uracil-DNA glycosylase family protein [Pelistega ratti]NEN76119.1 hypothetical protein [Pelistega ratti]
MTQTPLSAIQVQWLKSLGVEMLWGKPLVPTQVNIDNVEKAISLSTGVPIGGTTQENAETAHQASVSTSTSSQAVEHEGIALIKRSSPEGKTKSGRLVREEQSPFKKIIHGIQGKQHAYHRQLRENQSANGLAVPVSHAQTWDALANDISRYYQEWGWITQGSEVLMGQQGDKPCSLMIIDEMPSTEDFIAGELFSGSSGQLLENMLKPLGLGKSSVAMTSLLKVPLSGEVLSSHYTQNLPFLRMQIQWLQPRCIWLLGSRIAQPFLSDVSLQMDMLRSKTWFYPLSETQKVPVIVSHHPSLVLLNTGLKADIWEDLQKVDKILKGI